MASGQFSEISGDAGQVLASAGAKVGIISRWKLVPTRQKPDGTPELQFKAQFSWRNDVLMNMLSRGALKGRVQVTFRSKMGMETIDIVAWDQWRMDGGILYLDNVTYFEAAKLKQHVVARGA